MVAKKDCGGWWMVACILAVFGASSCLGCSPAGGEQPSEPVGVGGATSGGGMGVDAALPDAGGDAGSSMPTPASAGDLAWTGPACQGPPTRGLGDTILVPCAYDQEHTIVRFNLKGERVDEWPRAVIADADEGELKPLVVRELDSGDIVIAATVRRNIISGNPGSQSRVRVYRFATDHTLHWMTEITSFPDGPNEYPRAIAVSPAASDARVAVAGFANFGGARNKPFAAVIDATGKVQWRVHATESGVGHAVALTDEGKVHVAGESRYRGRGGYARGALWSFSAAGTPDWVWLEPSINPGVVGVASNFGGVSVTDVDVAPDGSIAVVGRRIAVDELVPMPPRCTVELWHRSFNAGTGTEVNHTILWTTAYDGMAPERIEPNAMRVDFARNDTGLVHAFGGGRALGAALDGKIHWEVSGLKGSRYGGALEIGHLVCAVDGKELNCYHRLDETTP